jgi:tRNA U34 2-thiouridine synthase MnmA/TrmU
MPSKQKVAMALSGGMDSAVAAGLLRRQGWNLQGVHLRLSPPATTEDRVQALAQRLDIPLAVIDLQREFSREVLDYFVSEYARGRTPNPCVQCNAAIKFGRLWERLRGDGFTHLATGHYARILPAEDSAPGLFRGAEGSVLFPQPPVPEPAAKSPFPPGTSDQRGGAAGPSPDGIARPAGPAREHGVVLYSPG